ncbi:MAG: hypothetical protein EXR23_03370 [Flavobacteriaceae bacterium]|nr:hypothetical protein [Flavobacteriaceae bacterium]PHX76549.1 MAG: hypothetical protein CK543_05855 [Flavobacteriales bacterium]
MSREGLNQKPKSQPGDSQLSAQGDYYMENGFCVFTADYHKKRGFCCGNECRHCPFAPKHLKGGKTLSDL